MMSLSHSLGITSSGAGAGRRRRCRGRQRPTLPSQPFKQSCRTDSLLADTAARRTPTLPSSTPWPVGWMAGRTTAAPGARARDASAAALPADDLPWPLLAPPIAPRTGTAICAALALRRSLELFRPIPRLSPYSERVFFV
jgi:hypothetical protein